MSDTIKSPFPRFLSLLLLAFVCGCESPVDLDDDTLDAIEECQPDSEDFVQCMLEVEQEHGTNQDTFRSTDTYTYEEVETACEEEHGGYGAESVGCVINFCSHYTCTDSQDSQQVG